MLPEVEEGKYGNYRMLRSKPTLAAARFLMTDLFNVHLISQSNAKTIIGYIADIYQIV